MSFFIACISERLCSFDQMAKDCFVEKYFLPIKAKHFANLNKNSYIQILEVFFKLLFPFSMNSRIASTEDFLKTTVFDLMIEAWMAPRAFRIVPQNVRAGEIWSTPEWIHWGHFSLHFSPYRDAQHVHSLFGDSVVCSTNENTWPVTGQTFLFLAQCKCVVTPLGYRATAGSLKGRRQAWHNLWK